MNTRDFLKDVQVATPCRADWNAMEGNEKKRFCLICRKHVHNFSAMTDTEIMDLYTEKGSDICIRFYVRRDGTMIIGDCPVGVRRKKRNRLVGLMLGIAGMTLLGAGAVRASANRDYTLREVLESNPVTAGVLRILGLSRPMIQGAMMVAPRSAPVSQGNNGMTAPENCEQNP
jgi:hypothetical protein